MFPTPRSHIRVDLDDTATSKPISCKPPNQVAQVKILRRPTHLSQNRNLNHQSISSLASNEASDNKKTNNDNFVANSDSNIITNSKAGTSTTSQQPMKWSVVVASSNRSVNNNNNDTKSICAINKQLASSTTTNPHCSRSQTSTACALTHNPIDNYATTGSNDNNLIIVDNHKTTDNNLSTVASRSRTQYLNQNTTIASKNNRIDIKKKTYQERADEYAKARLRILGSAFPDDDGLLSNTVQEANVNRLL